MLFVTNESLDSGLIESQILEYLTAISKTITDLNLLSVEPGLGKNKIHRKKQELLKKEGVRWFPCYPPSACGWIKRYLLFGCHVYQIQRERHHSVIHARSFLPALISKIVQILLWRQKIYLIFDTRGFWCLERMENEKSFLKRLFYKMLRPLENWLYHSCQHVIFLTERAKEEVISRQKISAKKISVIPTLVNCLRFRPSKRAAKQKIKNICFSGNILGWYDTDKIFEFCFQGVAQKRPFRYFFFAKDKNQQRIIQSRTKNFPFKSIIIQRFPFQKIARNLSRMNLGVILIKPSQGKNASFPTRIGEFLASGIPVLASRGIGDLDKFIKKNQCGLLVHRREEGFRKTFDSIEKIFSRNGNLEKCRQTALKHLSLTLGVKKILAIYKNH